MTAPRPRARRPDRRAAAWIVSLLLCGALRAQSTGEAPRAVGFSAGPFVIGPSLTTGYAYNSNVFLNTADLEPQPDQVLTVQPAIQIAVPFSNSIFRLGDTLTWTDYQHTPQDAGKTANDALADLTFRFSSFDELALSAHSINGVAETLAFDPGGEVTFHGNSYTLHTEAVALSRVVEGARGYRLSVRRNAIKFDPTQDVLFYDYRGFDGEGAYLQPLSPNTRLAFGYLGTRYDHFDNLNPTIVFRTENGDTAYAQVEGQLGPRQPYSARLGWERLHFDGNAAKDYDGIIGEAKLSAIVGGGTTISGTMQRQPYRSFFQENNFYLYDAIGAKVSRPFSQGSEFGGSVEFVRNRYAEPVEPGTGEPAIYRHDRAFRLEAYANLAFRERVVLRLSIVKQRRYSNFPGSDYDAIVVFGGFVFGWI